MVTVTEYGLFGSNMILNWLDKRICTLTANKIIEGGGLRGDISDKWKSLGFKVEQIPGMYI